MGTVAILAQGSRACAHFHRLIDMTKKTATKKTTTPKAKTTKPTKATSKKITGTEVTKKIWAYIKKNSLNQGRTIKPDSTLKAIFPVASIDMLKMAGYVSKHLS